MFSGIQEIRFAPTGQCHDDVISSKGNIFCITGYLCGESTGHRWRPNTKASDSEHWSFLLSAPQQTIEETMETRVIWGAYYDVIVMTYVENTLSVCWLDESTFTLPFKHSWPLTVTRYESSFYVIKWVTQNFSEPNSCACFAITQSYW